MAHQCEQYSSPNKWNWQTVHQNSATFLLLLLLFSLLVAMSSQQAFARILGLIHQTTQRPRDAGNGSSDDKDVRVLEMGKPIKRELFGGQLHTCRIMLSVNQFPRVIIDQIR
jgi:hypothetical protein